LAISPDQQLVAVIYHPYAGRSIGVYSTRDWLRVAAIDLDDDSGMEAIALAFSPDSRKLAIAHGKKGRVDILEVGSWKLLRTIEAFPEQSMKFVFLRALAFSADGSMVAVASGSGGVYWQYPDGSPAPEGKGKAIRQFPYDPLRVFRVDDGSFVASAAEFAASFDDNRLAWSPASGFLAFVDSYRQLRLWSPAHPGPPIIAVKAERNMGGLAFSPNGAQLAVNFLNGVKIFDVISRNRDETQDRRWIEISPRETSDVNNCSASYSDFEAGLKRLADTVKERTEIPSEFLQRHFAGCTTDEIQEFLRKNGFDTGVSDPAAGDKKAGIIRSILAEKTIQQSDHISLNCRIILDEKASHGLDVHGFFYFDGP
jgi:WD40 repeat protein